jgi:hypothetical protein
VAGSSGRAVWGVGFDCSDTGIVGSNSARGMNDCPRLSVLCCPVYVEALRRAEHSSKDSYQISKQIRKTHICEAAKVLQGL